MLMELGAGCVQVNTMGTYHLVLVVVVYLYVDDMEMNM